MNLPPSRRTPPDTAHARARRLAAAAIDGDLAARDAAWLDEHLAGCIECAAIADDYATDRQLLRSAAVPVPPRDLWARTAARLDRETAPSRRGRSFRLGAVPTGALAGVLVVAVVVGASYLASPGSPPASSSPSPLSAAASPVASTLTALATPIAIDRKVGLLRPSADGTLGILTATVDEVCGSSAAGQCQADTGSSSAITVGETAKSVVQSPNGRQIAVVLSTDHGASVVIVPAPSPVDASAPPPAATPTPAPTSPAATSTPPAASPTAPPSGAPSATASPSATTRPTAAPASPSPSATSGSSQSPEPSGSAAPSAPAGPSATPPLVLPSPSLAAAPVAIAADVTVIGQSAAYSPSGSWFAFSARPSDGSRGPDIYVWHVGDAQAHPVTTDHRSVFSTWVGDNVLGSRAEPLSAASADPALAAAPVTYGTSVSRTAVTTAASAPGVEARSVSFLLNPTTGASRVVPGDGIWRPVVDPSGRFAVYWSGTIEVDPDGLDWRPANGTLVLARWDPSQLVAPVATAPTPSAASGRSPSPSPTASPGTPVALLASPPVIDWDARWDETGTYLGVWVADRATDGSGRLSLHTLDVGSGTLDGAGAVFTDQPAASGFAIGRGRLAWVAPEGTSGAVVKVYAWAGAKGGTAQTSTQPEDTLVIR